MFRAAAWLGGIAILLASARAHGDVPLELRGRPVVAVEIAGETAGYTPTREVGIPLGAPLSRGLLRNALQRLASSGRWADIQITVAPEGEGVRVIAWLAPRLVVARTQIEGNTVLSDGEVRRTMTLAETNEIRRDELAAHEEHIETAYAARGYERADATVELQDTDDPTRKVLLVRIDENAPTRVIAVSFRGERPPPQLRLREMIDVAAGDVLDRAAVDDAIAELEQDLRAEGWLDARLGPVQLLRVSAARVAVVVPTVIGPRYEVRIFGHEPLGRSDVDEILELDEERLAAAGLDEVAERVLDLYRRHGFHWARVDVRREPGPRQDAAVLAVRVTPGPQLDVVAISFPGARHFETEILRDQVWSFLQERLPRAPLDPVDSVVAERLGLGGDPTPRPRRRPPPLEVDARRIWYAPIYVEAIEHVRELYQSEGFLSARVGPAELVPVEAGGRRHTVAIPIIEGPRTLLDRVTLRGNDALTDREVLDAAAFERGGAFSWLGLDRARARIVERYQEAGFYYAAAEPTVRFSGDRTRAEVRLQVVERYPVTIDRILVRGAVHTQEQLILDRLRFVPGDLFRPSAIRESQDRLLDLGIFAGVTITPLDPDLPARRKAIVVTVNERPGQFLEFSFGVSTGEGVRGGFEYGYRNLFGYALALNLRVQLAYQFFFVEEEVEERFRALQVASRLERNISLGFTLPHVGFLPEVRTSLAFVHARDNERDFGLDKNGVVLSLAWRPSKRFTLTLSEELENNNVELFVSESLQEFLESLGGTQPRLERLLRVPEGESTLVASRAVANVDRRDNPFVPHRGFLLSGSVEWARTLSTEQVDVGEMDTRFHSNFFKVALAGSGYVPIGSRVVWATQARWGRVFHLDDRSRTYPNRSFFLGGVETLRGYFPDALVPEEIADQIAEDADNGVGDGGLRPNAVFRGGDTFVLIRSELRFPIAGALHGGLFADFGNLWSDPDRLDLLEIRATAGLGVRFETPVGPLALDYGFILVRREWLQEPLGALHFSIGVF